MTAAGPALAVLAALILAVAGIPAVEWAVMGPALLLVGSSTVRPAAGGRLLLASLVALGVVLVVAVAR